MLSFQHSLTAIACVFCLGLLSRADMSEAFVQALSTMRVLELSCKLSQRRVLKLPRRRVLKLSRRCVSRSFRASSLNSIDLDLLEDVSDCRCIACRLLQRSRLDHTSMRRLQKRTNRSSMMRQVLTKNRVELYDEFIDVFRVSMFWVRFSSDAASIRQQISRISWRIHCEASTFRLSSCRRSESQMQHIGDSCCDPFDSVTDVSQISSISHLTLRSHWLNIYVIWL